MIAGAMRCGTTSLNAYLRSHPQITVSRPKEVHFFDNQFDRGVDWYLTHFTPTPATRAIGEATPDYLYSREAPRRIADTYPEIKLLVLLRDPADRAYSHYWHNRSVAKEDMSFEDALAAEPERISADPQSRAAYSYLDRGRYAEQLERYLQHFATGQILVETFEELQDEPAAVYLRACRFVGVDDTFRPENLGEQINAYARYRSPALRRLTKPLPKRLRDAVARINRLPDDGYDPMEPSTRQDIHKELRGDNQRLLSLVGLRAPWL